jgi:hypothetical protein
VDGVVGGSVRVSVSKSKCLCQSHGYIVATTVTLVPTPLHVTSLPLWLHCCHCGYIVVIVATLLSSWLHCCHCGYIVVIVATLLPVWPHCHHHNYMVTETIVGFQGIQRLLLILMCEYESGQDWT